jgi:hypothetical protein
MHMVTLFGLSVTLTVPIGRVSSAQQATASSPSCAADSGYHQFDFWIGNWDVVMTNTTGPVMGHSSIQSILAQCIVFENWTGTGDDVGKSFNSYDPVSRRWHQTWVDSQGSRREFEGEYKDGAMRYLLIAQIPRPDKVRVVRMTLFNYAPDSVRQWKEYSLDSAKTWKTVYDIMYHRARSNGTRRP